MENTEDDMCVDKPPQLKRNLEASGSSATTWYWSDEDDEISRAIVDKYYRQVSESDGFDVDGCSEIEGGIQPSPCNKSSGFPLEVVFYAMLGLHCYNIQEDKNFQIQAVEKFNSRHCSLVEYFITLEAKEPSDNSLRTFQICVVRATCKNGEHMRVQTMICRLKPATPGCGELYWQWEHGAIDDFYKGHMPSWPSDDALCEKSHKYYLVQEAELRENNWLFLYAELAVYCKLKREGYGYEMFRCTIPLDIKMVIVETWEDVDSHLKVRANNAIFYIIFKTKRTTVDYKAIIRRWTEDQVTSPSKLSVGQSLNQIADFSTSEAKTIYLFIFSSLPPHFSLMSFLLVILVLATGVKLVFFFGYGFH